MIKKKTPTADERMLCVDEKFKNRPRVSET